MGLVLQYRPPHQNRSASAVRPLVRRGATAQILMFTGVRYERYGGAAPDITAGHRAGRCNGQASGQQTSGQATTTDRWRTPLRSRT
ncbi:MAG: hypothetical protein AAF141_08330 [Pseudomonadota bacterium]